MPKCEFTEFSYAQQITSEIFREMKRLGVAVDYPILPTPPEEARLGYDMTTVASWGALFIQYKVSKHLTRRNSNEYHHFRAPYYRFPVKTELTPPNQVQHNILYSLEMSQTPMNGLVFYIAPLFSTHAEFRHHCFNEDALDHSVYAKPSQLGIVNPGDAHCYAYSDWGNVTSFSSPSEPANGSIRALLEQALYQHPRTEPMSYRDYLVRLNETVQLAVGDYLVGAQIREREEEEEEDRAITAHRSTLLIARSLGLETVVFGANALNPA